MSQGCWEKVGLAALPQDPWSEVRPGRVGVLLIGGGSEAWSLCEAPVVSTHRPIGPDDALLPPLPPKCNRRPPRV